MGLQVSNLRKTYLGEDRVIHEGAWGYWGSRKGKTSSPYVTTCGLNATALYLKPDAVVTCLECLAALDGDATDE